MLTPPQTSSNYSSAFFSIALIMSLVLHGFMVYWFSKEPESIQSGSATRINIAMRQVESKSEKKPQESIKKEAQQKPEIAQLKPVAKQVKKVSKPQEKEHHVTDTKLIEQKTVQKKVVNTNQHNTTKPVQRVSIEPSKKQTVKPVNKSSHFKPVNDQAEAELNTNPQPIAPSEIEEKKTEAIRYELGSNNNPKPGYPTMARKRGWQGEVILGVYVRPDGSIKHLTFVKSTDYGVLNHEAYETVRTSWKFKELDDDTKQNESMYIEIPFTFDLANN